MHAITVSAYNEGMLTKVHIINTNLPLLLQQIKATTNVMTMHINRIPATIQPLAIGIVAGGHVGGGGLDVVGIVTFIE